jgi:hypothetical protein
LHDSTYSNASGEPRQMDRRRHRRVPVLRPVKYLNCQFGTTQSLMLDLSVGGAYIESPVVPQGSLIEIEFNLINGHSVRAKAVVCYVVLGAGMGVEFEQISDEDRAQIAEFVDNFHVPVSARAE